MCNSSKQRQGRRQFQRRPRRQDKSRVNKVEQESDGSGSDDEYVTQVSVKYEINHIKGTVKQVQEKTMVKTKLKDVKVMFSVDSGSSVNLIDEERFSLINERSKTKLKLKKSKVKLFGYASKQPITVLGSFDAVLEVNEKYLPASFLVVKGKTDSSPSLGCDTPIDIGVPKIVNEITKNENYTCVNSEVQDITKEYDFIFHGIGKHKHAQVRLLENTSVKPVAQKNRRIPYHYREKLETEIKRLLDADVIEEVPANEPTTWLSPVVIVPKQSGEIRMCIDIREPSKGIERVRYEILTVDDIIHELNGAIVFSKFD